MEGQNILYGDIEELKRIRDEIKAHEKVKTKVNDATLERDKYEKDIEAEEKLLADTIDATIKKRREQVVENFDKELKSAQDRLKKVRNKRDKAKNQGIEARIKAETAEIEQENKTLKEEIKTYLKLKKIPAVFNIDYLYGLFFPRGTKDLVNLLILAIIFIVALPTVIINVLSLHIIIEVILFIIIAALFPAAYVLVYRYARIKNKLIFMEKREQYLKINKNKAQIKRIKRRIKRDKNEEQYNLAGFDDDIVDIEDAINDIVNKKNIVLNEFEAITKNEIIDEINARELPKIESLKRELNRVSIELKGYNDTQKNMAMDLTVKYGAYLGAENMTISKIDAIINIMQTDDKIQTIGDAINMLKATR